MSVYQDFITNLLATPVEVTMFLRNGVKLTGTITAVDDVVVKLERDGNSQIVFISAIATIMPVGTENQYERRTRGAF